MWKDLAAVAVLTIAITHPVQLAAEEAPASEKSLAEQLVDAFNAVFGVHPGMRANHPKGVVLEGTFTPSPSAASLTKAAHLQKRKAPIPVTVRFSAGSGLPTVPDTNDMPRGMAVKFALPDGTKTDLVVLSFNGFPVANAEEFRDFLLAVAASGPDAPKPTGFRKILGGPPGRESLRRDAEAATGELRTSPILGSTRSSSLTPREPPPTCVINSNRSQATNTYPKSRRSDGAGLFDR